MREKSTHAIWSQWPDSKLHDYTQVVTGQPGSRLDRHPDYHARSLRFYHAIAEMLGKLKYPGAAAFMVSPHYSSPFPIDWDCVSDRMILIHQPRASPHVMPKQSLLVAAHLWFLEPATSTEHKLKEKGVASNPYKDLWITTSHLQHRDWWETDWVPLRTTKRGKPVYAKNWSNETQAMRYIKSWLLDSLHIPGPD
jgi:hypothetical protein